MAELRRQTVDWESPPAVTRAGVWKKPPAASSEKLSDERREIEGEAADLLLEYESTRTTLGEIEDPTRLLLQARGSTSVGLMSHLGSGARPRSDRHYVDSGVW